MPGQDPNVVYPLGSSPGESARLQRQADELAADSAALLDRVGLRPGHSVIDLGCGPRGILDLLAERVSPAGRVADPWIGRRVPELYRQAGLEHVQVEARVQMYPPGNSRRTLRLDLVRSMRPQVLEMGLVSGAELDELDAAARAHLDDPHTIAITGLLLGRRGATTKTADRCTPHGVYNDPLSLSRATGCPVCPDCAPVNPAAQTRHAILVTWDR